MVTIPLMNPYETRVLPAVVPSVPRPPASRAPAPPAHAAPRPPAPVSPVSPVSRVAAASTPRPALRRLALQLQGDDWLEIWDDRIVTRDQTFTLDETFNAEVTRDWRAPLTVEAQLGLALRDERGRWNMFVPQAEEQIWQAAHVLRGVCAARGLDLPDLESAQLDGEAAPVPPRRPPASMPIRPATARPAPARPAPAMSAPAMSASGKHTYEHDYGHPQPGLIATSAAWMAPDRPNAQPSGGAPASALGMTSDTALAAIVHLSVLFLPVLLPATVWLALRRSVPWVAGQAREAARFQAMVWCLGALLLGVATLAMLLHGFAMATLGLLAFVVLLAAAGVYAFYAVLRATNGAPFRYLDFLGREH